ncbi:MAG: anhydro-N-acetylmuramic acid kinase [Planctomycetia bacterium]|nr:anhydro-N-acetylmuramic acid kinase [Planctomycetia bacterium]
MVEVQVLDRLCAVAQRRRWIVGLAVGSRCRQLRAALVGVEGAGLSSRVEVAAQARQLISPDLAGLFARLRQNRAKSPLDAALLAAQLAESQASLLDDFAARIAPVWDRVLAVAVDDPGLWGRGGGLTAYLGLCDAARLAELSGHNVIDAFPARDLAQEGRGRPLLSTAYWMLLHDLQKTRALVDVRRAIRITYLPGSRDATGARRILYFEVEACADAPRAAQAAHDQIAADAVTRCIMTDLPQIPPIEELVLCGMGEPSTAFGGELTRRLPAVRVLDPATLGIPLGALKPAAVALLGLLHLDQIPANATGITGARIPRVLGRLTPGSLANWHRLVREMANAKPSVVALRSAV